MTAEPSAAEKPVTVVVRRRVLPGRDADMEAWLRGVVAVATRFPGHMGVDVVRPAPEEREWTLIFRFDGPRSLRRWEESPDRAEWLARAAAFTEGEARMQVLTGLEYWFEHPDHQVVAAPRRWRQAVVTWLAIYPLATLLSATLRFLGVGLPLPLATLVMSVSLVVLMTYLVMPQMTRLFAGWLFPRQPA